MERRNGSAREDQFLGALLGFAIGDATGSPMAGLTEFERQRLAARPDVYPSLGATDDFQAVGEVTSLTDIMLCIVESVTTNSGMIDPENINARLAYTAGGSHRHSISAATIEGIELASTMDGLVPESYRPKSELAVALRGIPVGLLHAVGGFDADSMANDSTRVARLSHGSREQAQSVNLVAGIIQEAARSRAIPDVDGFSREADVDSVLHVLGWIEDAKTFEDGGPAMALEGWAVGADCALASAILGAAWGVSAIPQYLIDGLDARIYLSLAAPWFFRAAQRRAGTVIDLRVIDERG